MMAIIEVKNLSKSFDYYVKEVGIRNSLKNLFHRQMLLKEAVKDISFQIEEGEIVGFLGPNGAGKTTTLKMLSGILFPSGGNARVMGFVPWERKKEFKKQFSIIMGQRNQLWWDLPANESLYLNKCIYEIGHKEYEDTVTLLTEVLDVKHLLNIQVRRLSLGERMKMEIIAALLHKPKVILLDEPTIGLDIISQKNIRDFLKKYNRETKTTIMLTSHYVKDIEDLCKRAVVINKGGIVYDGSLDGINEFFVEKKILKVQSSEKVSRDYFDSMGHIREYDGFTVTLEVEKSHVNSVSKALLDTLPVVDLNIEDIPLEEGIERLYKKQDLVV